jgi:pantoate--beta-alanine ligase
METFATVAELRARLAREKNVVLVPTMGNLHDGHASLVEIARRRGGCVVATIFVNRLQFAPGGDFDRYPRTLAHDKWVLERNGSDVAFAPDEHEM